MPPKPPIPSDLRLLPFRGAHVVASGLLTRAQLAGLSWRRLFPDVYISADVRLDHRLWCEAALIHARGPGPLQRRAAVSGLSAAALMGVDLRFDEAAVEITVARTHSIRPLPAQAGVPSVRVVRADLGPTDVALFGRLPATTPVRTAFDIARALGRVEAVVALDALARKRVVRPADVAVFARLASALPGRRQVLEVIELVDARSESPMESRI